MEGSYESRQVVGGKEGLDRSDPVFLHLRVYLGWISIISRISVSYED